LVVVTVIFSGVLARVTGVKEEPIELPVGSQLHDLIVKLNEIHGDKLKGTLTRSQSEGHSSNLVMFDPQYVVLVTEPGKAPVTVGKLHGIRTILQDGSMVTFLAPVAGGSATLKFTEKQ